MRKHTLLTAIAISFLCFMITTSVYVYASPLMVRLEERLPKIALLKDKGLAKENEQGFLDYKGDDPEESLFVINENNDRMIVYEIIARKFNSSAKLVGEELYKLSVEIENMKIPIKGKLSEAAKCENTDLKDNGSTIIGEYSAEYNLSGLSCIITALDMPDWVKSEMLETRPIDGRRTAEWKGLIMNWSFDGDDISITARVK